MPTYDLFNPELKTMTKRSPSTRYKKCMRALWLMRPSEWALSSETWQYLSILSLISFSRSFLDWQFASSDSRTCFRAVKRRFPGSSTPKEAIFELLDLMLSSGISMLSSAIFKQRAVLEGTRGSDQKMCNNYVIVWNPVRKRIKKILSRL